MEALLQPKSRRLYSWWWDSHISPKNSKWLQENLTGANVVEFIINHTEVSVTFVQESNMAAMLTCLPRCNSHLKTIVSFGNISSTQKKEAKEYGVSCYSWEEFALMGSWLS
ncbi:probable CoA ligase CCL6 [Malania oleifera]|uniref:probable CoA ligase CCL6 n=1 Tax=Malania oleifera TaxID=397392 RepID=UPI0025AE5C97|nr:probable CoA ligase CCL6 [Malania oleifera]XP_057951847.1 probable CoA ligase CCL6 [Malania oleifera]